MNKPEPAELVLSPHTLIFSGFRWHVRAFSDTHGECRDFVLARVRGMPEVVHEAELPSDDDAGWHAQARVVIGPHPEFLEAQQVIIAEDYCMTDGRSKQ